VLLLIGADGAAPVVELLQAGWRSPDAVRISATLDVGVWVGLLVKGLPGSRMRSGTSLLESTERVRTEAKRALAPGA
jgi:hypothetical protein